MRQKVFFEDMGIRSYQPSWDYQEALLLKNTQIKWAARQNEQDLKTTQTEHRLLMVEHNPVFTLGIVGYPILDLDKFKTDLGWYLRSLEQVIIDVMAEYGLKGERSDGETGVWLEPNDPFMARKICAMGIKCSRWITMHGFALNVNTDLSHFEFIVPCGIQGKTVTSLEKELGHTVNYEAVKEKIKKHFQLIFDCELV